MNPLNKQYERLWEKIGSGVSSYIHGLTHWERVFRNGLMLARQSGADPRIIELFALLHDCRRENDGHDPEHGKRAAIFAGRMRSGFNDLNDQDFRVLRRALAGHNLIRLTEDITIATCWDADRLDLGRIGTVPDPSYMNTEEGRKIAEGGVGAYEAWMKM